MAGDADFDKVSLLLHMDGADGSTIFTDSSAVPKTVAASGGAVVSTAQSKWGGASLALGGSGDYLSSPAHADFVFGVGDFTVELLINTTTAAEKVLVDQYQSGNTNSWQFAVRDGRLSWYSGGYVLTGAAAVNNGAWHHVAAARSAGTLRFFVDGVLDGSAALGHNFNTNLVLGIGAQVGERSSAYDFPGYIDELRITKGVGRYTANFTPPTESFPDTGALYALSGAVTGSTGSPVARAIRAQREDTGAYVGGVISNATTGAYTIPTEYPGEHTVVVYPVTGENLPALVHHGVIPI